MNIDIDLAEAIADEVDGTVRTDYSGRGMYGKTCFGIDTDQNPFAVGFAIAKVLAEHDQDALAEILYHRARFDAMGLGSIVYFPGVTVTGESIADDDD